MKTSDLPVQDQYHPDPQDFETQYEVFTILRPVGGHSWDEFFLEPDQAKRAYSIDGQGQQGCLRALYEEIQKEIDDGFPSQE